MGTGGYFLTSAFLAVKQSLFDGEVSGSTAVKVNIPSDSSSELLARPCFDKKIITWLQKVTVNHAVSPSTIFRFNFINWTPFTLPRHYLMDGVFPVRSQLSRAVSFTQVSYKDSVAWLENRTGQILQNGSVLGNLKFPTSLTLTPDAIFVCI